MFILTFIPQQRFSGLRLHRGERLLGKKPVFGNQSMESIFPTKPDSWHLMLIFEKTIRRQPSDRWQSTREVLEEIAEGKIHNS